jgi:hypothetical protein
MKKENFKSWRLVLTLAILATLEAEIGRILIQG